MNTPREAVAARVPDPGPPRRNRPTRTTFERSPLARIIHRRFAYSERAAPPFSGSLLRTPRRLGRSRRLSSLLLALSYLPGGVGSSVARASRHTIPASIFASTVPRRLKSSSSSTVTCAVAVTRTTRTAPPRGSFQRGGSPAGLAQAEPGAVLVSRQAAPPWLKRLTEETAVSSATNPETKATRSKSTTLFLGQPAEPTSAATFAPHTAAATGDADAAELGRRHERSVGDALKPTTGCRSARLSQPSPSPSRGRRRTQNAH